MTSSSNSQTASTNDNGEDFAQQASRCRRLADATYDRDASSMLQQMAADYEERAKGSRAPN